MERTFRITVPRIHEFYPDLPTIPPDSSPVQKMHRNGQLTVALSFPANKADWPA
ncbi:hypothetical protein D3C81_2233050 [compost metagenome]